MAEFVQRALEQMLPELEDMQENNLFTRDEIRALVKKRTHYEYQLQRRVVRKIDFIRYIKHEMNLEAERNNRKRKLGIYNKKKTVDFAIINRIHRLYQKALRKFRSDSKLWLEYIAFSKNMGSTKVVSKAFSRMLQAHPYRSEFWILAAKWEFEDNKDIDNARRIMQLAIRRNSTSKSLWPEYFRLELLYVDKMRKRRQVLNISEPNQDDSGEMSDEFFANKIADVVYQNAVKAIPDDIEFRMSFIGIYKLFESTKQYRDAIYNSLLDDFPDQEASWHFFAEKEYDDHPDINALPGNEIEDLIERVQLRYEEGLKQLNTVQMWDYYLSWYYEKVVLTSPTCLSKLEILLEIFEKAAAGKKLSENKYFLWIKILQKIRKDQDIPAVLEKYIRDFNSELQSWKFYLTLLLSYQEVYEEHDIENGFDKALKCLPVKTSIPIWQLRLEWYLTSKPKLVNTFLEKTINLSPEIAKPMQERYLEWTALNKSIRKVRKVYTNLIANSLVSIEFLCMCVDIEQQQAPPDISKLRKLYDLILSQIGESSAEYWIKYIKAEKAWGQPALANTIYWKALKTLQGDDNYDFIKSYALL
ncbi:U3 small nucleolar RNA-associated protein 6-like protein [Trichoplax sp. H2]|nr:U3 small nucleolar RNA-associated protein 6-like protein [Trichoplax sp. H2]|eukprot:RDD44015.1 U3 small nucleolar RNA-associated protein 6-like protein [Trichoplax sp. H2]